MRVVFLFIFLFSVNSYASRSCSELLADKYYFMPHSGKVAFLNGNRIAELGSGRNGTVSRITSEDGVIMTIKDFKHFEAREHDLWSLQFLGTVRASDLAVRPVKAMGRVGSKGLILENIYGQPLDKFLKRKDIPEEIKYNVFLRYAAYIGRVQKAIRDQYGEEVLPIPHTIAIEGGLPITMIRADITNGPLLLIKPENIVVDSATLELVVIDPN